MLNPEYNSVAVCGETSLTPAKQDFLFKILFSLAFERVVLAAEQQIAKNLPAADIKPKGKKMGVYVDGVLRLQTHDRAAIDEYADKKMRERHNVWIARVGSFVPAGA